MGDMFSAPWASIKTHNLPDDALNEWLEIFNAILNKHAPIIHKRVSRQHQSQWMSKNILHAINTRERLKQRNSHLEYRLWTNIVVKVIKNAKRSYYQQVLESNRVHCECRGRIATIFCQDHGARSALIGVTPNFCGNI